MTSINYFQILDLVKDHLSNKSWALSDFHVNLFLTTKCTDISNILAAYSYQSFCLDKLELYDGIYPLAQESQEYITKVIQDSDTSFCLIKILYRLAKFLFENKNNMFHSYYLIDKCLYIFKNSFFINTHKDALGILNDLQKQVYDNIKTYISSKYALIANNVDMIKLKEVVDRIKNQKYHLTSSLKDQEQTDISNTENISENQDAKNQVFYIISAYYIRRLSCFIENKNYKNEEYYKPSIVYEKLFLEDNKEYYSYFPGPIDNLKLIDFKHNWDIMLHKNYYNINSDSNVDNGNNNTTSNNSNEELFKEKVFIHKSLIENVDFYYINEEDYISLKEVFDSIYDIPRTSIKNNNNTRKKIECTESLTEIEDTQSILNNTQDYRIEIETYYKEVEVMFFSQKFKSKEYINWISNKYTQFTASIKYDDFIRKLKYIYFSCLGMETNLIKKDDINNYPIKVYLVKKNKLNLFQMLLFFYKQSSYFIEDLKVLDESLFKKIVNYKNKIKLDNIGNATKDNVSDSNNTYNTNSTNNNTNTNDISELKDFRNDKTNIDYISTTPTDSNNDIITNSNVTQSFVNDNKNIEDEDDEEINLDEYMILVELENINFLKGTLLCNHCNKNITGSINSKCSDCDQAKYCQKTCKEHDEKHKSYHEDIQIFFKKEYKLDELMKVDIYSLVKGRHGIVGLRNLGNTCFMNSAIQCLSHCEDLTKFFLLNLFESDLNISNKFGSRGQLAGGYSELIRNLWNESNSYLNPSLFRNIFVSFARQFSGFAQHDSHEMLTFVLDGLHEDLNRIRTKPYLSVEEQDISKESDKDASNRWWKNHLSRENSIVVDLFHGQYKTKISCPECKRTCHNYDSFMYLSVPIPTDMLKFNINMLKFNENNNIIYEIEKKTLYIKDNISAYEVKSKLLKTDEIGEIILVDANSKCFIRKIADDEIIQKIIKNDREVVLYNLGNKQEVFKSCNSFNNERPYSIYFNIARALEEINFFGSVKKVIKTFDYPYMVIITSTNTILDFLIKINSLIKSLLNNNNIENTYSCGCGNKNHHYKKNKNYETVKSFSLQDILKKFNLYVVNNLPIESNYFSSSNSICEFCNSRCSYCSFNIKSSDSMQESNLVNNFSSKNNISYNNNPYIVNYQESLNTLTDKTTIDTLFNLISKKRNGCLNFYLIIKDENKLSTDNQFKQLHLRESQNQIIKTNKNTLYDCLELFKTEEKLEQDNSWYCNKCKKHQEATVKMQIYRPPIYLIIHLKRFKIKSGNTIVNMLSNKKNDSLVQYPIELDLKDHVLGDYNCKYDLFAVNQHFGSLSSGHYTAICKNNGIWIEFDDDGVSKINESEVVNNSAYLLFYKMKL